MPNVLLTEKCIRKCPYCFAKQYMEGTEDKTAISNENFNYIVDFLEKSDIKRISLLGGEPLIHPRIVDIISDLITREFEITVFTSGIMPENNLQLLIERINNLQIKDKHKLKFIVNVNEPRLSNPKEVEKVKNFFTILGSYCGLSFNIYRQDFNPDFLLNYIIEYGLIRFIRFGIANPIPGGLNQFINPKDFKQIGTTLISFMQKMYELQIFPLLDCGFNLCMFSDEEIGKLYRFSRNAVDFDCSPSIDIGPDLSCWCCFPLSNINRKSLLDFKNFNELYAYFNKLQEKYRKEVKGIYQACDECRNFMDEICAGGCLAHSINKFENEGWIRNL